MTKSVGILATESALGKDVLTYEELERRFGSEAMRKVFAGSGVRNRRIAPPGVCGSDLAFEAASRLLDGHRLDRHSIDLLVFCTQSPDYLLPTTACILQERLGLKRECACFDINLGCSQYVYGLSVAHSMIAAGVASRALVLTGDTASRTIHPLDRSLVPLMGDGGSATLLGEAPQGQGFLGFELGTDGSGHQYLIIPAGGFRIPATEETAREVTDAEGNTRTQQHFYMNGAAVFHFGITVVPQAIGNLVGRLSLSVDDVDLFLFHQANKYMLDYLLRKLRIPPERSHFYLEDVGNTSGSALPLVVTDAWRAGKIRPGMLVLMIAFGVGLSWAATILRWPDNALGALPVRVEER